MVARIYSRNNSEKNKNQRDSREIMKSAEHVHVSQYSRRKEFEIIIVSYDRLLLLLRRLQG